MSAPAHNCIADDNIGCAACRAEGIEETSSIEQSRGVRPTPDRQPSDAAVEGVMRDMAMWDEDCGLPFFPDEADGGRAAVRHMLTVAYRVDAPRPLLDREAVERAIATKVMYYNSATAVHEVHDDDLAGLTAGTDAVMELARPMPTREAIRALFRGPNAFGYWIENLMDDHEQEAATDAVLDLLNGAGS